MEVDRIGLTETEEAIEEPVWVCDGSYILVLAVFGGPPDSGRRSVFDSFASSYNSFPCKGSPHPALMRGFVPGVIVSCCVLFDLCACSVTCKRWEVQRTRRSRGRVSCGQDVLYERRLNKNQQKKKQKEMPSKVTKRSFYVPLASQRKKNIIKAHFLLCFPSCFMITKDLCLWN